MFCNILFYFITLAIFSLHSDGCLITNCPRGGKRSEGFRVVEDKNCIPCGPGHAGRCFGTHICCGPFGCLMGTLETLKCRQAMFLPDREPCEMPGWPCKNNNGKCVADGICCTHDACHTDKECDNVEGFKYITDNIQGESFYNLVNKYQSPNVKLE